MEDEVIKSIFDWILIILTVGAVLGGIISEYIGWNKGICKKTGKPWELFDHSSQGCRGYQSESFTLWVSWPVDRNFRKQK